MGRRPIPNKKLPSEYPQMAFRVSEEEKLRLTNLIEDVQSLFNKRRKEGDPFFNKNDIIVRALDEGLKVLKKAR
jgi:hypothetical protein